MKSLERRSLSRRSVDSLAMIAEGLVMFNASASRNLQTSREKWTRHYNRRPLAQEIMSPQCDNQFFNERKEDGEDSQDDSEPCEGCLIRKRHRHPFRKSENKAEQQLDLAH